MTEYKEVNILAEAKDVNNFKKNLLVICWR